MVKTDQKAVAIRYGLQPQVLGSWMHHLVYIRNLCAHHSRLWDRSWTVKPRCPDGKRWERPLLPGNKRLFVTLLVLSHLMSRIPARQDFVSIWRSRVEACLDVPPAALNPLDVMGLTPDWRNHPVWAEPRQCAPSLASRPLPSGASPRPARYDGGMRDAWVSLALLAGPLFIAWSAVELGLTAFRGRGIPIMGTRRRLSGPAGKLVGAVLIGAGGAGVVAYCVWAVLTLTVYR